MYKQIILFGAGQKGREALSFFGQEAVYCFVDNDVLKHGTWIGGKKVLSYADLLALMKRPGFDIEFELVITVDKSAWAILAVSQQLRDAGIEDFSVFRDVARRYSDGAHFVQRNRDIYPYEQEFLLKVYAYQYDYLKRHTNVGMLTPATGNLREKQRNIIRNAHDFFAEIKDLNTCYWMMAGSLMGAVRHGGFIPWDDDLDFCMMADDLHRVMEYLDKTSAIFRFHADGYYTLDGCRDCEGFTYGQFYGNWHYGWLNVFRYTGARDVFQNEFVTDIMPVHYYGGTAADYKADVERYCKMREQDFASADEAYARELQDKRKYPAKSDTLVWGVDTASGSWFFHKDDNKDFRGKIWDASLILPVSEVVFEGFRFPAPNQQEAYITQEYGDMMQWPLRMGAVVHDKDRLFREKY